MATYYVSVQGNDNNSGAIDQPLATVQAAIDRVQAGDTVYVRQGTHFLRKGIWIGEERSGTANARITLQAYPGEKVILDGRNLPAGTSGIGIGGQYIDVVGFELRRISAGGIVVLGGKHIQILNNIVHHTQGTGIVAYGREYQQNGQMLRDRASDILMANNTVYMASLINRSRTMNGGWGMGMQAMYSDRVTMLNNRIYNNYGEGIGFTMASGSLAKNNIVYNNFSVQMYMDNAINSTFESNFIYNTGDRRFYRPFGGTLYAATGIQLANETYNVTPTAYSLNQNKILNNIVVGGSSGFYYGSYDGGRGMKNILVANNTFYGSSQDLLHIDADDDTQNVTFVNNVFEQTRGRQLNFVGSPMGLSFRNNLWYGGDPGVAAGTGDIYADPLLNNPGGFLPTYYQLQAGSPAINAGTPQGAPPRDYFGDIRPLRGRDDIGADEFRVRLGSSSLLAENPNSSAVLPALGGASTENVWDLGNGFSTIELGGE
jgi:parallel beta-helix repeat protein